MVKSGQIDIKNVNGIFLSAAGELDALAVPEAPSPKPQAPSLVWSIDLIADRLEDGRAFRFLSVLDDYNREELGIEVDFHCATGVLSARPEWLD